VAVLRGQPCPASGQADRASSSTDGSRQELWATPQASDPAHAGPNQRDSSGRPALPAQVNKQGSGKLNPHWVFCLMGYPPLWAEIGRKFTTGSRSSKRQETQLSQKQRRFSCTRF
jgi:hypothetical protein